MESELQVFREYIRHRGLRHTPEREQILREIFKKSGHFDVDGLYLQLRQKAVKVSRASIYRALPLFIDCGLIREVDFSEGHWHYELIYGQAHHSHLRCLGCGETLEFADPILTALEERLARAYGYRIKGHQLKVQGYCAACQQAQGGPLDSELRE
jgi:Fur family ferric uptake transcriptional regulator